MSKRINVKQAVIQKDELHLLTDGKEDLSRFKAAGQILVDSDQLAFVYLVDTGGEYAYVTIPETAWKTVAEVLNESTQAYLVNEQSRLHLQAFNEEMCYLIENIKGNSNYGEEMVNKVERTF